MRIDNWNQFLIDESVVYLSTPFKNILRRLDHPIAKALLETEGTNPKDDISLVHFDVNSDNFLIFNTSKNVSSILKNYWKREDDFFDSKISKHITDEYLPGLGDDLWTLANWGSSNLIHHNLFGGKGTLTGNDDPWFKSTSPIKVGKLVNKLLPGRFSPGEIEDFTNILKSIVEKEKTSFKIVEGKDIENYYQTINYDRSGGTLNNSCMLNKPSSYFEIYTKNPDKVRLLVMEKADKVVGRAFVWKLNFCNDLNGIKIPVEYFLDRIYSTKDSLVHNFHSFAIKEGWAYRTVNHYEHPERITFQGKNLNVNMGVVLGDFNYSKYPYMDTFKIYDTENKTLHNEEDKSSDGTDLLLTRTDGEWR